MQHKRTILSFFVAGLILVFGSGLWLATAPPANAQCGSQASSCKSCHEVQGQDPVNGDGTSWHKAHAFGDFCYICHAGNNQAKDKAQAHAGMVPPLSDIKASCQQCHPNDLADRAQVYATALGVEIGADSASPATGGAAPAAVVEQPISAGAAPASIEIDYDDPNLTDYAARYDQIVLGKQPTNWGNLILIGIIGLVAVGGGGFVVTREKLVSVKFGEVKQVGDEYPAEVVEMLPAIQKLKSDSRKTLRQVLESPKADKVLGLIDEVLSDKKNEAQP
ncbi:MAG: hypothetical protein RBS68_14665 [Anaerolineales bacterium]|jgi:hypothetical protein|nr:hypothetical protein [Anaerolineales bacterium]